MKRFRLLLVSILFASLFIGCAENGKNNDKDFSFVFMTDIHVQWKRHAKEGFTAAVNKINKINPDFVITGGDLIMDALGQKLPRADSLYNLYFDVTSHLQMPIYNTIGNHEVLGLYKESGVSPDDPDYGKNLFLRKMNYDKTYQSFNYKGWHFILLDAIGFTKERKYYGHIDSLQIEWLKKDLQGISETTPIVISVHIPFFSIYKQMREGPTAAFKGNEVIVNALQVLDLFKDYNLKLVLQGHLHELEDIYYKGVHFITGGAVCAAWWTGPNVGHPEGFVVVDVKGDEFTWHYQTYGWDAKHVK